MSSETEKKRAENTTRFFFTRPPRRRKEEKLNKLKVLFVMPQLFSILKSKAQLSETEMRNVVFRASARNKLILVRNLVRAVSRENDGFSKSGGIDHFSLLQGISTSKDVIIRCIYLSRINEDFSMDPTSVLHGMGTTRPGV